MIILGCSAENRSSISVSIYPIKLILNEIGVNSNVVIDRLVDIHSFEPSIRSILNVQNSCGFIYISDDFEVWARSIKARYKLRLLKDKQNPHIWTNPRFILDNITSIESLLIKCKVHYSKEMLELFKRRLIMIDSLNKIHAKDVKVSFILLHASFEPFLRAYNLGIETILIKEGHVDILPSDLNKALGSKDKVIIAESYYSENLLKIFIKNGFRIIYLDPIGITSKNYTDFIKAISDSILLNKYILGGNL